MCVRVCLCVCAPASSLSSTPPGSAHKPSPSVRTHPKNPTTHAMYSGQSNEGALQCGISRLLGNLPHKPPYFFVASRAFATACIHSKHLHLTYTAAAGRSGGLYGRRFGSTASRQSVAPFDHACSGGVRTYFLLFLLPPEPKIEINQPAGTPDPAPSRALFTPPRTPCP